MKFTITVTIAFSVIIIIIAILIVFGYEKGKSELILTGNEKSLPPELKGMVVYDVNGVGKVAILNNQIIKSISGKSCNNIIYIKSIQA
jgi:hypothetical protein